MNKEEEIRELAYKEAENLRKYATSAEKAKLNISLLMPTSRDRCVYGLMTGNCTSKRACKLIETSCEKVYKARTGVSTATELNGAPSGRTEDKYAYWSPIEVFIARNKREDNEKLLNFIKEKVELPIVRKFKNWINSKLS